MDDMKESDTGFAVLGRDWIGNQRDRVEHCHSEKHRQKSLLRHIQMMRDMMTLDLLRPAQTCSDLLSLMLQLMWDIKQGKMTQTQSTWCLLLSCFTENINSPFNEHKWVIRELYASCRNVRLQVAGYKSPTIQSCMILVSSLPLRVDRNSTATQQLTVFIA